MPTGYSGVAIAVLLARSFQFLLMFLIPFLTAKGFARTEAATIQLVAVGVSGLFQPFTGRLLDRGYLSTVCAGVAAFGLSGIALILGGNLLILTLVGICFLQVATLTAATLNTRSLEGGLSDANRKRGSFIHYVIYNAGSVTSAAIAYFFLSEHANTLVFLEALSTSLSMLALYAYLNRNAISPVGKPVQAGWGKEVWPLRHVLLPCTALLFAMLCHSSTVPLLFSRLGLDTGKMLSLLFVVNTVVIVLLSAVIGRFKPDLTSAKWIRFAMVAIMAGNVALPFCREGWHVALATIVLTFGEIIMMPFVSYTIMSLFPGARSGSGAGMKMALATFVMVLGPLVGMCLEWLPVYGFSVLLFALPLAAIPLIKSSSCPQTNS